MLGTIRIASEVLTIECNSKKRLERGKKLLKALARPGTENAKKKRSSRPRICCARLRTILPSVRAAVFRPKSNVN